MNGQVVNVRAARRRQPVRHKCHSCRQVFLGSLDHPFCPSCWRQERESRRITMNRSVIPTDKYGRRITQPPE